MRGDEGRGPLALTPYTATMGFGPVRGDLDSARAAMFADPALVLTQALTLPSLVGGPAPPHILADPPLIVNGILQNPDCAGTRQG